MGGGGEGTDDETSPAVSRLLPPSSCDRERVRSAIGTTALLTRALLLPLLPQLDEATEPKLTLLSRLLDI